jgi:hypothetical protein
MALSWVMKTRLFVSMFAVLPSVAFGGRNPIYDDADSPGSPGLLFLLFFIIPVAWWLINSFISNADKSNADKSDDLLRKEKLEAHKNEVVKKLAEEQAHTAKENDNLYLDCPYCFEKTYRGLKDQELLVCHCGVRFKNPEWVPSVAVLNQPTIKSTLVVSERNIDLNEKYPSLSDEEVKEANWRLVGTRYTECSNCHRKDLVDNFSISAVGSLYRKCNHCGTNFQYSKSMLELQETIYARCLDCRRVIRLGETCNCHK